ncbi:hypothetical protein DSAG12_02167 [Promethearchaeum syntrophicum]|uniref:Uncharacterized protein n=1 Tax=Promethearchaeum syntrophicum TaxID=2594042 RepID=A0A5B9DBV4_9ARCH|nr:hypothetical protein [Candidatus Prometheoarchaeum syntrophicum]QEE16337.1 hypothetical protein DSAG12_02167 [Candidatus Prometheoarchaeum syntrophicum]
MISFSRNNIGCVALVFTIAFLISNSTSAIYNDTYEKYIFLESYYFEENQMIMCTIRSTVGMDYSIQFRRSPDRISGPEHTERTIEGNTFYIFTFNTLDSHHFTLVANDIDGITYHVKFFQAIPKWIINIGTMVFGLTYVIWVIYDKKFAEKIEYTMKADKNAKPKY